MRFVVTGTGRCGTGYTATLFRAAGLRCGHEEVFTDKPGIGETGAARSGTIGRLKEPAGKVKETLRRRRLQLDGDASWMAVPRLSRFCGVALVQLREPLAVIRSFTGTRFFSEPRNHLAQHRYAAAHFDVTGDDIVDGMRWWTAWNSEGARHARLVYRLEDLDAELMADLLRLVDEPDPGGRAERAVIGVPRDVNSGARRGDRAREVGWGDLPSGPDLDALRRLAGQYGYDVP